MSVGAGGPQTVGTAAGATSSVVYQDLSSSWAEYVAGNIYTVASVTSTAPTYLVVRIVLLDDSTYSGGPKDIGMNGDTICPA